MPIFLKLLCLICLLLIIKRGVTTQSKKSDSTQTKEQQTTTNQEQNTCDMDIVDGACVDSLYSIQEQQIIEEQQQAYDMNKFYMQQQQQYEQIRGGELVQVGQYPAEPEQYNIKFLWASIFAMWGNAVIFMYRLLGGIILFFALIGAVVCIYWTQQIRRSFSESSQQQQDVISASSSQTKEESASGQSTDIPIMSGKKRRGGQRHKQALRKSRHDQAEQGTSSLQQERSSQTNHQEDYQNPHFDPSSMQSEYYNLPQMGFLDTPQLAGAQSSILKEEEMQPEKNLIEESDAQIMSRQLDSTKNSESNRLKSLQEISQDESEAHIMDDEPKETMQIEPLHGQEDEPQNNSEDSGWTQVIHGGKKHSMQQLNIQYSTSPLSQPDRPQSSSIMATSPILSRQAQQGSPSSNRNPSSATRASSVAQQQQGQGTSPNIQREGVRDKRTSRRNKRGNENRRQTTLASFLAPDILQMFSQQDEEEQDQPSIMDSPVAQQRQHQTRESSVVSHVMRSLDRQYPNTLQPSLNPGSTVQTTMTTDQGQSSSTVPTIEVVPNSQGQQQSLGNAPISQLSLQRQPEAGHSSETVHGESSIMSSAKGTGAYFNKDVLQSIVEHEEAQMQEQPDSDNQSQQSQHNEDKLENYADNVREEEYDHSPQYEETNEEKADDNQPPKKDVDECQQSQQSHNEDQTKQQDNYSEEKQDDEPQEENYFFAETEDETKERQQGSSRDQRTKPQEGEQKQQTSKDDPIDQQEDESTDPQVESTQKDNQECPQLQQDPRDHGGSADISLFDFSQEKQPQIEEITPQGQPQQDQHLQEQIQMFQQPQEHVQMFQGFSPTAASFIPSTQQYLAHYRPQYQQQYPQRNLQLHPSQQNQGPHQHQFYQQQNQMYYMQALQMYNWQVFSYYRNIPNAQLYPSNIPYPNAQQMVPSGYYQSPRPIAPYMQFSWPNQYPGYMHTQPMQVHPQFQPQLSPPVIQPQPVGYIPQFNTPNYVQDQYQNNQHSQVGDNGKDNFPYNEIVPSWTQHGSLIILNEGGKLFPDISQMATDKEPQTAESDAEKESPIVQQTSKQDDEQEESASAEEQLSIDAWLPSSQETMEQRAEELKKFEDNGKLSSSFNEIKDQESSTDPQTNNSQSNKTKGQQNGDLSQTLLQNNPENVDYAEQQHMLNEDKNNSNQQGNMELQQDEDQLKRLSKSVIENVEIADQTLKPQQGSNDNLCAFHSKDKQSESEQIQPRHDESSSASNTLEMECVQQKEVVNDNLEKDPESEEFPKQDIKNQSETVHQQPGEPLNIDQIKVYNEKLQQQEPNTIENYPENDSGQNLDTTQGFKETQIKDDLCSYTYPQSDLDHLNSGQETNNKDDIRDDTQALTEQDSYNNKSKKRESTVEPQNQSCEDSQKPQTDSMNKVLSDQVNKTQEYLSQENTQNQSNAYLEQEGN
eukprot:TRINITY_DN3206_c0_g1_i2.p1 TRINITY_DN3206_c0_g1~~TRINITY_DN3206_c0_g1_i2.p1  ORF type:complete len:1433 (-),score=141.54 TRINITY_DN3206_c0_g1_i2:1206-5504(-)